MWFEYVISEAGNITTFISLDMQIPWRHLPQQTILNAATKYVIETTV